MVSFALRNAEIATEWYNEYVLIWRLVPKQPWSLPQLLVDFSVSHLMQCGQITWTGNGDNLTT